MNPTATHTEDTTDHDDLTVDTRLTVGGPGLVVQHAEDVLDDDRDDELAVDTGLTVGGPGLVLQHAEDTTDGDR